LPGAVAEAAVVAAGVEAAAAALEAAVVAWAGAAVRLGDIAVGARL
jgi:hypothetical protein